MEFGSERVGEVQVVTPHEDRLDAAVAIKFKDQMRGLTADAPGRIVLDMAQVGFVDSSGLGAIVGAMKQLGPGQQLELASLTPNVEKVFRLTRMDRVFRIHANRDAALTIASPAE
ncbi:MAG: STAS domain-containing protein [Mangrovicoccus sp.]|nr:STAS domain-containing protein [Mangrovicoccus sp.]